MTKMMNNEELFEYYLTTITNRGIKEKMEDIWNNPDVPKPKFKLARIANLKININDFIYASINYSRRNYTCYFAWRDHHADNKTDGAVGLHPENINMWSIRVVYADGFKEYIEELPLPVVEVLLYEVANCLATKCPYNKEA